jgi:TM2 domain-containing membrane protein YozV
MCVKLLAAVIACCFLTVLFPALVPAQIARDSVQIVTSQSRTDSTIQFAPPATRWTERKIVGTILSVLIPGSGQTYLGHTEKGAAFTLATLACGLVTGLSENNVIGRNERIMELKAQYQIATNYIGADSLWGQMLNTKSLLDNNVRRRDLFLKMTVAFWIANVVDIVFFSDDKGEKPFGMLETGRKGTTFALVPDSKNGINAVLRVQF